MDQTPEFIDCACVIHGNTYNWSYVNRLYTMLERHLTPKVRLHVYTEATRPVPAPMIKHALEAWSTLHPIRGWWYKMQLFNPAHHSGPLLYFDLDTVIVDNIDWIWTKTTNYFWAIRDFKYLWSPNDTGLNSSIMWWDTFKFSHIWNNFSTENLITNMMKYRGDQDYICSAIPTNQRRFFETEFVKSWRWQCLDGGYNFRKKQHLTPGTGTHFSPETKVLIFHGNPKPEEIQDPVILQHWG